MFDTYQDIFKARADSYHSAMVSYPEARRQEFEHAVASLDLLPGCTICDVPAGGGYLTNYVSVLANFLFVETSALFAEFCPRDERHQVRQAATLEELPVANESVERLLSLAALHHVQDKQRALNEFHRSLKPGGIGVVADVEANTDTARFLNGFVNQYNSMGHRGEFLDSEFYQSIDEFSGLTLREVRRPELQWRFDTTDDMAVFCMQLFGLDLATPADVIQGIAQHLGFTTGADCIAMNWQLSYAIVEKRSTGA